jgi:hypothetical protein
MQDPAVLATAALAAAFIVDRGAGLTADPAAASTAALVEVSIPVREGECTADPAAVSTADRVVDLTLGPVEVLMMGRVAMAATTIEVRGVLRYWSRRGGVD